MTTNRSQHDSQSDTGDHILVGPEDELPFLIAIGIAVLGIAALAFYPVAPPITMIVGTGVLVVGAAIGIAFALLIGVTILLHLAVGVFYIAHVLTEPLP